MADLVKKKFVVDTVINPFGETRTKKAPDWFEARPKLLKSITGISVKRTLDLDPRKWKTKDLVDGVYAVARYELALFSSQLSSIEKDIFKSLTKDEQKKKKFSKNSNESKEEKKALDDAESEVEKLYKKTVKDIEKKVSLALDEVESDKGDNKKALAAGKEAIKKFNSLDFNAMFDVPFDAVMLHLNDLAAKLKGGGEKKMWENAKAGVATAEKVFAGTAKTAQNIVKYLLDAGGKMADDAKANPALQKVGASIEESKGVMTALSSAIDEFETDMVGIRKLIKAEKADEAEISKVAAEFKKKHGGKNSEALAAIKAVQSISKEFNTAQRQIKR
ncbi:hypothetical protein [Ostreiculturibacter nitratireducens]|uniref:hypothetical protein n=1 Tax=Ostreiculturibacter nitratireducens TaxID=3075226 RepID=UPI0031B5CD63